MTPSTSRATKKIRCAASVGDAEVGLEDVEGLLAGRQLGGHGDAHALADERASQRRQDRDTALGRFTRKAERKGSDWIIADLRGVVATTPGYEPWNFALEADPSGKRWQLKLAFKKFPPPVRR